MVVEVRQKTFVVNLIVDPVLVEHNPGVFALVRKIEEAVPAGNLEKVGIAYDLYESMMEEYKKGLSEKVYFLGKAKVSEKIWSFLKKRI